MSEASLPDTLEELVDVAETKDRLPCETCGDLVERRYLSEGECVGCRNGPGVHAAPRTDGGEKLPTLDELHELPWSEIEGAHVRVEIEEDTRDPLDPTQDDVDDPYEYTEREGDIVGRGVGTGLYYDTDRGELLTTSLGPKIVLDTPEDTFLEVVTSKIGNELLAFDPGEGER